MSSRPCSCRERLEVGQARHRAVVVDDLARAHPPGRARRAGRGRRRPRCGRRASARRPRGSAAGRCGRAGRGRRARSPGRGARGSWWRGRRPRCRWWCRARASTDTVNAVRCDSVLSATISGSCSSSSRSPVIGMQITPLVWRIMNAIVSGVIFSAAMMRSPSFSRSSSSTTITIWPRPIGVDRLLDRGEDLLFRHASLRPFVLSGSDGVAAGHRAAAVVPRISRGRRPPGSRDRRRRSCRAW